MELVSVLAQHDKLQACVDALGAHLRLRDSGEVRRASSSLDAPWSLPGAEAPGTHTPPLPFPYASPYRTDAHPTPGCCSAPGTRGQSVGARCCRGGAARAGV